MPARPARTDAGVTLVETMVAVGLVGIVMTSLTLFFGATVSATSRQGNTQNAAQLADDATDQVRALRGSALLTGRDKTSTDNQWSSPAPGAASWLTGMQEAWDTGASYPAGATAALPTSPRTVTLNGVAYRQYWYVGRCWQPHAGGDCTAVQGATDVPFYRVVVAVTWPERHCSGGTCSYLTATLVTSTGQDPTFNANQGATAPTATNPGNQTDEVSVPVSLQLTASGGAPPLTWTATGLPPGLSVLSNGLVTGTPTAAGTWSVTVKATDGFGLTSTALFSWTVNGLPQLATPADQVWVVGSAGSLPMSLTGGTGPYAWTATGLPAGVSIDPTTGTVSGTPTAVAATRQVTITVTDSMGKADVEMFNFAVNAPLAIVKPGAQSGEATLAATPVQVSASGGATPYTWSASGLPPGLSVNSAGQISGTPTSGGTYNPTVTVTDSGGQSASTASFTWTVLTAPSITVPSGNQSTPRSTSTSIQSTASGGTGSYTWSGTGFPTGLSISNHGKITGAPTSVGTFTVTVTVTDSAGATQSRTFTWTVT